MQVVALITIEVHARDVIDKLTKSNCSSVNDFEWVSQLRFYWDRDLNECVVKQVRRQGCVVGGVRLGGFDGSARFYHNLNECVVTQVRSAPFTHSCLLQWA